MVRDQRTDLRLGLPLGHELLEELELHRERTEGQRVLDLRCHLDLLLRARPPRDWDWRLLLQVDDTGVLLCLRLEQ